MEVARTWVSFGLPQLRQVLAVEVDHAPDWPVQAAEDLQQRRLAVPGRALDGQPLAVLDHQVDAAQRGHGLAALDVVLGHSGELVHGKLSCGFGCFARAGAVRPPWQGRPRAGAARPASRRRSGDDAARDGQHHREHDHVDSHRGGEVHGDSVAGRRRAAEATEAAPASAAGTRTAAGTAAEAELPASRRAWPSRWSGPPRRTASATAFEPAPRRRGRARRRPRRRSRPGRRPRP